MYWLKYSRDICQITLKYGMVSLLILTSDDSNVFKPLTIILPGILWPILLVDIYFMKSTSQIFVKCDFKFLAASW